MATTDEIKAARARLGLIQDKLDRLMQDRADADAAALRDRESELHGRLDRSNDLETLGDDLHSLELAFQNWIARVDAKFG